MSSNSQSTALQQLIQAFAEISSTEDFILYVAGTDSMLPFCQELLEQYDRDDHAMSALEVNSLCAKQGILPHVLYSEIRKVLIALNRFHDTSLDHYATLGLKKNATISEIKKAYRQLSKHYHPDMAQNNGNGEDTQRFMEIAGAYHSIMATHSDTKVSGPTPWRKKDSSLKLKRQFNKKSFLFTVIPLIIALGSVSFYIAMKYDEKIILSQMQSLSASESKSAAQLQPTPSTEAYSAEPIQPVKNDVPPPAVPPSDDLFVQKTAVAQVLDTLPTPPAAEPEKAIAPPGQEEETTLQPQAQPHTDLATVEEIRPPDTDVQDIPEPDKQVNEDPDVAPAAIAAAPAPQPPIQQVAQAEHVEKSEIVRDVQPIQQNVPDQKILPEAEEEKQPEQNDQGPFIEGLLTEYVNLYNARSLEHFFTLFHENARENGKLQAQLIDQYKSLFSNTEAIDLSLEDIHWQEYKDGYEAKSKFTANYKYKDGQTKEHIGNLTFYIREEQGSLKIQSLDYVFLN